MTTDELISKILRLGSISYIGGYWNGLTVSVSFYYPSLPANTKDMSKKDFEKVCNFTYTSPSFSLTEALEKCLASMPLPSPSDYVNKESEENYT